MEDFIRRYYMDDTSHCDAVIEWFESDEIKKLHGPGRFLVKNSTAVRVDPEVKESTDVSLGFNEVVNHPPLYPVVNWLWECVLDYANDFDYLINKKAFEILPTLNIQKYNPPSGGYKDWHYERSTCDSIFLVWMIYLNDVEKGGGTSFKYLDHTEKAEKGKCILWPADFTHLHKGEIAPEETKYIMTGWYQYKAV